MQHVCRMMRFAGIEAKDTKHGQARTCLFIGVFYLTSMQLVVIVGIVNVYSAIELIRIDLIVTWYHSNGNLALLTDIACPLVHILHTILVLLVCFPLLL